MVLQRVEAAVEHGGPPLGSRHADVISHARCRVNVHHALANGEHIAVCTATAVVAGQTEDGVPIDVRLSPTYRVLGVACVATQGSYPDPYCVAHG